MTARNAGASIKGYSFQFIKTIQDILEGAPGDKFTLEKIEDLDILKSDETQLNQYKYHEGRKLTNSLIAKPITLMYNHFCGNTSKNYKYKLYLHCEENPTHDYQIDFSKIFTLQTSKAYQVKDSSKQYYKDCYEDEIKIKQFEQRFYLLEQKSLDQVENKLTLKIMDVFSVTEEESRYQILPLAYKLINSLSVMETENERTITKKDFIAKLTKAKKICDYSFLKRTKDRGEYIRIIKKEVNRLGIKKTNSNHIFLIGEDDISNVAKFIFYSSQLFFFKDNKRNYQYPVYVIKNTFQVKIELLELIDNHNIELDFNDGYEEIKFSKNHFNKTPLIKANKGQSKIDKVAFNFKIVGLGIFKEYYGEILSNGLLKPSLYLDDMNVMETSLLLKKYPNVFYIPNYAKDDSILEMFKE